ncbi:MAG TPA: hypothetical protein VHL57_03800 [Flavobacteriales bacterium]|jgi:hypothetical protein|nr:hypothetical protein [Flavobacteriales bacterium]
MRTVYTAETALERGRVAGHVIVARRIDNDGTELSNKVVAAFSADIDAADVDRQAAEMQAGYDRVREYATTSLEVVDER